MLTFGRSAYFCEPVFSMQPVYDIIKWCMGKSFIQSARENNGFNVIENENIDAGSIDPFSNF